jgi:hypothetical protein
MAYLLNSTVFPRLALHYSSLPEKKRIGKQKKEKVPSSVCRMANWINMGHQEIILESTILNY